MKLFRLFLPMLALMMLATGCTKEYIMNGAQIQTVQFNITPSEWMRNEGDLPGTNNYLYCTKDIDFITEDVFNFGTVQAYAWNVYDAQHNLGAWNTLPFVYPLEVYVTNDDNTTSLVIVPENLRFEWELGKVTFIIQDLDGYDPEDMVSTISIKVNVTSNMKR